MGNFELTKVVAIDTETTGLNFWTGDVPFAVSICNEHGHTWYCQWLVDPCSREVAANPADVEYLRHVMENPAIEKVFHNAKFDCRMLETQGISWNGFIHDTHIAARVCNNLELSFRLKTLSRKYLGIGTEDESELELEVKRCRRLAQQHNRAIEAGKKKGSYISLGEDAAQDYWLPRYYDPKNELCGKYCQLDTLRTMGLRMLYQSAMEEDPYLREAYLQEMELWHVVNRMEYRGMHISEQRLEEQSKKARVSAVHHKAEMIRAIQVRNLKPFENGTPIEEFNPSSPIQIRRLLYNPPEQGGLGLNTERKSGAGSDSTDRHALHELAGEPFVADLVAYRAAEQAISLFFDKFPLVMVDDPIVPGQKIIRPGLNQCGTVTFRFSCSNPNLQQVTNLRTMKDPRGSYSARVPFGPRPGYFWYAGDYAQQELRLFADIAQIPFLLSEINAGRDPNNACANKAWGGKNNPSALRAMGKALELGQEEPSNPEVLKAWSELEWSPKAAREFGYVSNRSLQVADEYLAQFGYDIVAAEKSVNRSNSRGTAKCIMFAKIYGGGPGSILDLLHCTLNEAKVFFSEYDKALPEVTVYMNQMIHKARRDGFIITPYGRKIRVESDLAYRAVNYMIQGTAACMMKDSIVRCDQLLRDSGKDAHVLMTIHDEILFEISHAHSYKWLLRSIVDVMEDNSGRIGVPMPVELKRIRESWDDKEPFDL